MLGRVLTAGSLAEARADDHRTVHYPGRTYPALVAAPGRVAEGLVVGGLSPGDLAILDAYEGTEYRREPIRVTSEAGTVRAQAYLPTAVIAAAAPEWRFADWLANHSGAALVEEGAHAAALRARLEANAALPGGPL